MKRGIHRIIVAVTYINHKGCGIESLTG